MSNINSVNYERVGRENLKKALARKELNRILKERLKSYHEGSIIVIQTPAENYTEANISSVKTMIDNGYEGIYLSFQRPYKNISSIFEKNQINLDKILVVDCASAFSCSNNEINPNCINVDSSFELENVVEKICLNIGNLKSGKKFVFVDSLSTLALHQTFSETLRFSEFLVNSVRKNKSENVTFIFNVAKELGKKRFIQNIDVYADEHIHLGLCT